MRRREAAEAERVRLERLLRPDGAGEADRDPGLEQAWARRLGGEVLRGEADDIQLFADGSYDARFAEGDERGLWWLSSCVGRASLRLEPAGGEPYGFVLTRGAEGVALNGVPYAL